MPSGSWGSRPRPGPVEIEEPQGSLADDEPPLDPEWPSEDGGAEEAAVAALAQSTVLLRWEFFAKMLLKRDPLRIARVAFGRGTVSVNIMAAMRATRRIQRAGPLIDEIEEEEEATPVGTPAMRGSPRHHYGQIHQQIDSPRLSQRTSTSSTGNHTAGGGQRCRLQDPSLPPVGGGRGPSWPTTRVTSPVSSSGPSPGPCSARPSSARPSSVRTSNAAPSSRTSSAAGHRQGNSSRLNLDGVRGLRTSGDGDTSPHSPTIGRSSLNRTSESSKSSLYESGARSHIQFELLQAWASGVKPNQKALRRWEDRSKKSNARGARSTTSLDDMVVAEFSGASLTSAGGRRCNWDRFMMSPMTLHVVAWDVVGMLLIFYDFIMVPLQILGMDESIFTVLVAWFARIFWTLGMPRSLFTGYVTADGGVEMRSRCVLRNYLMGWFVFDALVAGSDWLEFLIQGVEIGKTTEIMRATRFIRVVRSVRLVRLLKLPALVEEFSARFYSEKVLLLVGIVKISLMFTGLGHIIACLWIGFGTYSPGTTWVSHYRLDLESFFVMYMTAVHWAITQFIGTMEVEPQNIYERVFAIIVLLQSFIVSAAFVSRVTASMTRLQILAGSNESQFAILRQYLRNRSVSKALARRVVRSATHAVNLQAANTSEKDVELLAVISEPLRIEVHYEIYAPVLTQHPFFQHYGGAAPVAMRKLCHAAVEVLHLHTGDQLFTAGEASKYPKMFFLMTGALVYRTPGTWATEVVLGAGAWATEANLWVHWVHVGELAALKDATILALDSETFQQIVSKFVAQTSFVVAYAKSFVAYLNHRKTVPSDLRDERDFPVEEKVWESIREADEADEAENRSGGRTGSANLLKRVRTRDRRARRIDEGAESMPEEAPSSSRVRDTRR